MALWQVSKGESRTVIAIPSLGVAMKCARIRMESVYNFRNDVRAMREAMQRYPHSNGTELYWEFVGLASRRCFRQLFGGVAANWGERRLYKHIDVSHKPLLQPTYFSLLGILNLQKYGKPADEEDSVPIYYAFFRVAGRELVRDGHHWVNAQNFHLANDGPKVLDYGSLETQRIIKRHGYALYTRFDIEFGRAEAQRYKRASAKGTRNPPASSH